MSEYQLSRKGWVMSLAFCSFGMGSMLLAQVIPPRLATRSGRLGRRGLWLIGMALFAAGLFPPFPTRSVVAYVHGISGLVVILASPIVFQLVSRSVAHEAAWSRTFRHLRWATALAWGGLFSFLGSTAVFAGRTAGAPVMGLHPAISISNVDDRDLLSVVRGRRMGTGAARVLTRQLRATPRPADRAPVSGPVKH
jgi:Protein of unknown function (DUF998)